METPGFGLGGWGCLTAGGTTAGAHTGGRGPISRPEVERRWGTGSKDSLMRVLRSPSVLSEATAAVA